MVVTCCQTTDVAKVWWFTTEPRNFDPSIHPFQQCREYARALNATKIEKMFAKPFLGSLDGHRDGVFCLAKHPKRLPVVFSGSYDGEIRVWNIAEKRCLAAVPAHDGFVRGLCVDPQNADRFLSVGDDKCIKEWSFERASTTDFEPVQNIATKHMIYDITHNYRQAIFATSGEGVFVWDYSRTTPLRAFDWGVDSVQKIRFNPVETNILAAAAADRSIILYDSRGHVPLRKVVLKMKSNAIAWNPMEAFSFVVASEDYNLYTFDMRNLSSAVVVHIDHVAAVMDVDISPTGKEFVSGSYDKTLRIFPCDSSKCRHRNFKFSGWKFFHFPPYFREVYHTKRMQRIMSVLYSNDSKYILSGSDEMNIRLWKAVAWEKLGPTRRNEKEALAYNEKLKAKFAHHPEIKRIRQNRHVPKHIFNARKELSEIRQSKARKESNIRLHSKPGTVPEISIKKQSIVGEHE
uniref:DDB1- and CUL4-associated factor 13 n=1 Tax=Romanomermis culicivorax TaxID=13658 RepID=A0A915I637_ROMCU